ncbi:hypothetical protein SDC9_175785 [bioreactor metagenome]|uniref:Uncharacterized protein n=1 Tax=bioreactor metagenome TaxID=1076179 RepID=A0A645GWD8_9ZZZZ
MAPTRTSSTILFSPALPANTLEGIISVISMTWKVDIWGISGIPPMTVIPLLSRKSLSLLPSHLLITTPLSSRPLFSHISLKRKADSRDCWVVEDTSTMGASTALAMSKLDMPQEYPLARFLLPSTIMNSLPSLTSSYPFTM